MDQERPSQEITSLVGREVYSTNGVFVGEIEDIKLDLETEIVTGLALHDPSEELFGRQVRSTRGILIPYRWVRAVGDVVLVNDVVERLDAADENEDEAVA
ncbi:MAG: PRC-barrel domain-containing protein [Euryarchaeota archaeon]|jgi:sporulation protein YlmC with PRC-barrel domain|nr:PRC-barrel domain-containing protein [Euryarchaeota archaeon]